MDVRSPLLSSWQETVDWVVARTEFDGRAESLESTESQPGTRCGRWNFSTWFLKMQLNWESGSLLTCTGTSIRAWRALAAASPALLLVTSTWKTCDALRRTSTVACKFFHSEAWKNKKSTLRDRFTAPFSHIFFVLKMCENVGIRRFYASDPTFSVFFPHFQNRKKWKNGAVNKSKGAFHHAIFPNFFCFENAWKCRIQREKTSDSDIFTHFQNRKNVGKWPGEMVPLRFLEFFSGFLQEYYIRN